MSFTTGSGTGSVRLDLADDSVSRSRAAVRHEIADLDFGIARARAVGFLRKRNAGGDQRRRCEHGGKSEEFHLFPSQFLGAIFSIVTAR